MPQAPLQFMSKVPDLHSCSSLTQLWEIYAKGGMGRPALADLEAQYEASWRTYPITSADTEEQKMEKRKLTRSLSKRM